MSAQLLPDWYLNSQRSIPMIDGPKPAKAAALNPATEPAKKGPYNDDIKLAKPDTGETPQQKRNRKAAIKARRTVAQKAAPQVKVKTIVGK